jgi:hypothetical protein
MPFSIDLCLTNTGNTVLGPTFLVFSDTNPNVPFTTINLSDIVQTECPYVLSGVPDNATSIRLLNLPTGCCIEIPITGNLDLCIMCDLGFNVYSANTVSVITAGNLTGSCDDNITDYVVNWYGPDSSTNIQFTSGKGNTFTYDWIHPLTGNSSVFAPAGVYTPKIESIILNGELLQEDYGVLSNCFSAVTVEAFNCSNGNNTNPPSLALTAYSHVIEFSQQSQGNVPPNLSAIFELSANTNFLAFAFKGASVPDSLKISFSGASYSTPLVMEYITVGDNLTTSNLNPNSFPKSADTLFFFSKVLNLQDTVTVLPGDYLIIEVEPNPTNPNTEWTLYLKCLETFNCVKCIDTNTPHKILQSSITGITGSCGQLQIQFVLTGCSNSQNNSEDVFKYFLNDGLTQSPLANNGITVGSQYTTFNLFYSALTCSFNQAPGFPYQISCYISGSDNINFRTYRPNVNTRILEFKFEGLSDFNAYLSNFLDAMQYSGSSDPTNITYYSRLFLSVPAPSGGTLCGDNTTRLDFTLHPPTLDYATGTTIEFPYNYTFSITSTTISNGASYNICDQNCLSFLDGTVNTVNASVTGSSLDITGTTTVSSRYQYPFYNIWRFTSSTTNQTSTFYNFSIRFPTYSNATYVASGTPLQNISTMSATTCDFSSSMYQDIFAGVTEWYQYVGSYLLQRTNPNNPNDFRIMASVITNGQPSFLYDVLAYGISGGTVYASNPTYIQS